MVMNCTYNRTNIRQESFANNAIILCLEKKGSSKILGSIFDFSMIHHILAKLNLLKSIKQTKIILHKK
jgi:hypothetical protein